MPHTAGLADRSALEHRKLIGAGWVMLMELDGSGGAGLRGTGVSPVRSYTWGLDLAGLNGAVNSLQEAGGIGGLLAMQDTNGTPTVETDDLKYVYLYDANGNVGQLVAWAQDYAGTTEYAWDTQQSPNVRLVAAYEYDPYGNITAQSGAYAGNNPFRFSTKYYDTQTGMGYWGYRYYSPGLGRWVSRDPIAEAGDLNLFAFVRNGPIAFTDALGLKRANYTCSLPLLCGVWVICPDSRDLDNMKDLRKRQALIEKGLDINDVPGFDIEFFPEETSTLKASPDYASRREWFKERKVKKCCCRCDDQSPGSIRIVQVVSTPKWPTRIDPENPTDTKIAKRDYPWGYVEAGGMPGRGQYGHFDAPNYGLTGVMHSFEACAVCRHDGKDEILGCVQWEYFDGKRKGEGRGLSGFDKGESFHLRGRECFMRASSAPLKLYREGIEFWKHQGG